MTRIATAELPVRTAHSQLLIKVSRLLAFDKNATFKEEDHPRGQPENAGEFVKKGSGSTNLKQKEHNSSQSLTTAPKERDSWPEHIKTLKLPPAWTDIKYSNDPDANLLAIGKDSKGRSQYVYNPKFAESQSALKFQRVKNLAGQIDKFTRLNDKNLNSANEKTKELAECLGLIMSTGIRPGSERDTQAEKHAYGATTLEGKHVVSEDGKTYLRFTGKKGVSLNIPVEDKKLAKALQNRAKKVGPDGQLFASVNEKSLREYTHNLTKGDAKPKDFRTLLGTSSAYKMVKETPAPKSKSEYKKRVMFIAKSVAQKLGNTPTIALKAYISPYVFAEWQQ